MHIQDAKSILLRVEESKMKSFAMSLLFLCFLALLVDKPHSAVYYICMHENVLV